MSEITETSGNQLVQHICSGHICSEQGLLEQVSQGHSHSGFEYLQEWKLYNFYG